jgi:hypothetical protein
LIVKLTNGHSIRRALDPSTDFALLPVPKIGDWVEVNPKAGQGLKDFQWAEGNRPDAVRDKIYLRGGFTGGLDLIMNPDGNQSLKGIFGQRECEAINVTG